MSCRAMSADTSRDVVFDLNRSCDCLPLSAMQINQQLQRRNHNAAVTGMLTERPNLFAATAVMLAEEDRLAMQAQIESIESAIRLEGYRAAIALRDGNKLQSARAFTPGVLMSYDFHLTPGGPRLIEVNTNAGGAFVVSELLAAVTPLLETLGTTAVDDAVEVERRLLSMIISEWQHAGRSGRPTTLAIVDAQPAAQYLYPDMQLACDLFARHGIDTRVVDVSELRIMDGQLQAHGRKIDMVYNRLTDFPLTAPENLNLRRAWLEDLAVISPAPEHHALYADKRNLPLLRNESLLRSWGLEETQIQTLSALPHAEEVTAENAADLWSRRRGLFFKPSAGYGARATYRGSKLTHKTWAAITAGNYIAQEFIAPGTRHVSEHGQTASMKFDLRVYTYAGQAIVSAARIYQGQTTNFRTPGGGFAITVSC